VGVILGAAYMLWLVQRVFYGGESKLALQKPTDDLQFGELAILTPVVVLMLVMGVAPMQWINTIETGVHLPPIHSANTLPPSMLQLAPPGEVQR